MAGFQPFGVEAPFIDDALLVDRNANDGGCAALVGAIPCHAVAGLNDAGFRTVRREARRVTAKRRVLQIAEQRINEWMPDAEQFTFLLSHRQFAIKRDIVVFWRDLRKRFQAFGRNNLPKFAHR